MRSFRLSVALGVILAAVPLQAAAAHTTDPAVPYLADAPDPAVTSLANEAGIPISEARQRIGWQDPAMTMADEILKFDPTHFGGIWFDTNTGRVKIGIVGPDRAAATSAADRWQLSTVTDFVPVEHSYGQLQRDSAWLGAAMTSVNALAASKGHAQVQLGSALQTSRNRVVLRVPAGKTLMSEQLAMVQSARTQLGSRVAVEVSTDTSVERQACSWSAGDFDCDPPLRGGTRLYINGSQAQCSTGFNARSNSNKAWYVMTAGHCGGIGTVFTAFQPANRDFHTVGPMHNRTTGSNDYGIVTINNPAGWNPRNWVYVHASPDTVLDPDYTITSVGASAQGGWACMTGSTSGTDCGTIVELNWNGVGGFARARYCSDGGDSGGAVYSNHAARGIHVGVVRGHEGDCLNAVYQGITEAANALNVHVVIR